MKINDLWEMNVPELRRLAKENNVAGYTKMTKSPLVENLSEILIGNSAKKEVSVPDTPEEHDQYFTRTKIAKLVIGKTISFFKKHKIDFNQRKWIEPSVGAGAFYNNIPESIELKLSLDLDPSVQADKHINFYDYKVPKNSVVFGNPPFGHRGEDALRFINHSKNADFVAFILPMFFASNGKGSAQYRVEAGKKLVYQLELPADSFELPDGKRPKIYTVFQIWAKIDQPMKSISPNVSWYSNDIWSKDIEMFTICTNKNRLCGLDKIGSCDLYVSSSFYGETKFVDTFDEVNYGAGIGINFRKKTTKEKVRKIDVSKYANRSTSGVYHLGISTLRLMLIKEGIVKLSD